MNNFENAVVGLVLAIVLSVFVIHVWNEERHPERSWVSGIYSSDYHNASEIRILERRIEALEGKCQ